MTATWRAALAASFLLAVPVPGPIELPAEPSRSEASAGGTAGCRKKAATAPDAKPPDAKPAAAEAAPVSAPPADELWSTKVRPMLAERCAPCHNPGGKMYERLPFDDPAVLRSHVPGAKKRLKGEDAELFARWLASQ